MPFASGKTPTRRQLFLGLAAAGLLAACTPQIDYRGYQPRGQDLARVQIGMTKAEVEAGPHETYTPGQRRRTR